jgi:Xaa-Pro aminopeptidase
MDVLNQTHRDDGTLERLLKRAGVSTGIAETRELVAGVAAAPDGFEPDAWIDLVCPGAEGELKGRLTALLAEFRAQYRADDGEAPANHPSRLAALRAQLKRRRLAGFVVPHGDEHQGEYVAPCSERLTWLTGFTGSAGTAVVLKDQAAMFVDGRYTVQARTEVSDSLYEIRHSIEEPLADWVSANLPAKGRLGYDPWLHTPAQVAGLRTACARAGGRLAPVTGNPVDAIWTDRPPPPIAPIFAHVEAFTGSPSADKRGRVAETLFERRQDAVVLSAPDSIAWLLNIRGGDVPYAPLALAFAVLHADASVELFVDPRKLTPGVRQHLGEHVSVAAMDGLGPALDRLGAEKKAVCVDPDGTPDWIARRLRTAGAEIVSEPDPCALAKAVKNPVEIEGFRGAHRRDGAALCRFLAWLAREAPKGTLTEVSAAERLEAFRRENAHFRGPSFPTISAFAGNGAVVHYRPSPQTDRSLEAGSLYLVDSGGQYLDGTTDVTRTVAIGAPSEEMRARFTRVLKGHIALATTRFPKGTTGPQLDTLARLALWDVGLDYDHGTGHGVGNYLSVHEGPQRISKIANRVALRPGMIVSNEPGYYKTGAYGIRIENLVTVTVVEPPEDAEKELFGFETLTLAPIDLALVAPDLLTAKEAAWLDAYHARVRETLTPLVDDETAEWLRGATRPVGV